VSWDCPVAGGDVCGVTTGNRSDSPDGLIVAPGMGASGIGGSVGTGLDTGVWPTTAVIAATAGDSDHPPTADDALTVTMRVIGWPPIALARTRSVIITSNA